MFESAISRLPRIRAWMFSSVTSRGPFSNAGSSVLSIDCITSAIGSVNVVMLRFLARAIESSTLPRLEKGEGISTPSTFAGPSASHAIAAVSAESIPPERPSTTCENPHLRA